MTSRYALLPDLTNDNYFTNLNDQFQDLGNLLWPIESL
ncbi:hypothetical protein GFO_2799 [Christiangramia forsetii KT0803]|uniref:Uncharacterized protein n=1 Tax=Christiangramia forsetii (strain DSM 17595 / CGMCC 1.15422 / KT0803) TaxID=411154 RepID=A0M558_CHRFK|nr:hypothetical protein GFO_2799 [Christiangramia forsetii KT0803]